MSILLSIPKVFPQVFPEYSLGIPQYHSKYSLSIPLSIPQVFPKEFPEYSLGIPQYSSKYSLSIPLSIPQEFPQVFPEYSPRYLQLIPKEPQGNPNLLQPSRGNLFFYNILKVVFLLLQGGPPPAPPAAPRGAGLSARRLPKSVGPLENGQNNNERSVFCRLKQLYLVTNSSFEEGQFIITKKWRKEKYSTEFFTTSNQLFSLQRENCLTVS